MAQSVGQIAIDLTLNKDGFENGIKNVGSNAIKTGDLIKSNIISSAVIGGFKMVGNAVQSVGSAILDVGKQAIASYADYEQLVGGVETLFKDNAGTVEEYANNAYKTAGLSANEYMETVTGFSASLLQSLKGDTAKAAEIGNMAVTDMADNANKMGTSMESIQTAYQGFAKQNYTMLDNLKLGYGGTKEEMQRLLKDAQKMPEALGQKFDISNYSDVVKAINVVQQHMGIAGTTAKEASSTIQGSLGMLKSSWQNVLTGIADENANFDVLINNLVDSLGSVFENLLPRIEVVLGGIGKLIMSIGQQIMAHLPEITQKGMEIITSLVSGIQQNLPIIMQSVTQVISTLLSGFITMLPQLIQMGITVIISLVQGIAQSLPTLIPQIVNAVLLIVQTLIDNIDLLIDAGIQLIIGLAEGLINALPQLIEKIPVLIDSLINALVNNMPKLIQMGITLTIKLAEGLIQAIPQLVSKIPHIIKSLVEGFISYYGKIFNIGVDLIVKFCDGIVNHAGDVKNAVVNGISGAIDWIKELPGKALSWGADIVGNIAQGIKNAIHKVTDAVKGVADKIKSFLHFSEPDVGPLSDFSTYMPDMMDLMSKGIKDNTGDVMKTVDSLANQMSNALCIEADTPEIKGTSASTSVVASASQKTSSNDNLNAKIDTLISLLTQFTSNNQQTAVADTGDITIPVYIGNSAIDELIVTAQQRRTMRSGGKS